MPVPVPCRCRFSFCGAGGAGGSGAPYAPPYNYGRGGYGVQLPATFRDPSATVGAPGPTSAPTPNGFDTSGKYWVAGGGGGGNGNYVAGSSGGSGVVIIAAQQAAASVSGTYSVDTSGRSGWHVYTFTAGTGSITF